MSLGLDEALQQCPVVAIVRGVRPEEVLEHAQALYDAGIRGVEVPLNSPEPLDSIGKLAEAWGDRMVVGAGTVLTAAGVDDVARAGGRIIVSPNASGEVIRHAVELGLDPAPGFATPTEAFHAIAAGAKHLKLFPAVTYGPAHVKQIKAVLPPEAVVWAVGGVGAGEMAAWWEAARVRSAWAGSSTGPGRRQKTPPRRPAKWSRRRGRCAERNGRPGSLARRRSLPMRQLAKFSISVREQDFVLHLEDDTGQAMDFAASPEQLDTVIDALDELLSEDEEELFEVEAEAPDRPTRN